MQKRLLLIAMTIISCQAFSQKDTSKIEIKVEDARRAFKELIEKDYLENQVVNLEIQINTQKELLQNKEFETDNLNSQIEALESLSKSKDLRINNYETIIKNNEKEISRKKLGNTFWKITTVLSLIFSGYLAVK